MKAQERFIERHKDSEFRYKDELFNGLNSSKFALERTSENSENSYHCKHFLDIYKHRAGHLKRYDSLHAIRLREDTLALCEELAETPDEICYVWTFSVPPYSSYEVFVSESGKVLGTLFTVSQLKMPSDEWEKLWGKDNS
ncbi:MAG TPA: hypothetical protein VF599_23055 [Pyrinomonadaceae bacterium]|jgi:hypothetical protein